MNDRTFQKFAGAAAFVVALSSLSYVLVFLFLIPTEQNPSTATGFTMTRSLTSFAANPTGRQLANVLLVLGGLATTAAVVGIYHRLREKSASWAMWSLCLGFAYSILTTVYGVHTFMLLRTLSDLYVNADASTKSSIVVIASTPSPLDPYGFSKFFLSGVWLLITGWLMLRSAYFPRLLAYLALLAAIGVFVLYLFRGSLGLVTGVPGAALFGPLFWIGVGYTMWTKE
ncbi:MAG: hypothetical protein NVSMB27_16550 [Ktedonobacteraceae bacterium]